MTSPNGFATTLKDLLANKIIKPVTNPHRPGAGPDVLLFATPRGGSTWLMEMIWSQPGFRACTEPLDLRNPLVRRHLPIASWEELYGRGAGEAIERYFRRLSRGELRHVQPLPWRGKHYRFRTDRTVFKVLHGAEEWIGRLSAGLDARVVLLLRHPIPVSLSREVLPRLEAFLASDYRRHFEPAQLRLAQDVARTGSALERGVLDWCFQNAVPLRDAQDDWCVVTYEQLVLEPEVVLPRLARQLRLPDPEEMLQRIGEASHVIYKSDPETRRLLERETRDEARHKLIEKWRAKVGPREEERAMAVLEAFGIDAYRAGDILPSPRYWIEG